MCRKIDSLTAAAFRAGRPFSLSNTAVTVCGGVVRCYLHGNLIAERSGGFTRFQSCGWNTPTTRQRLQACGLDCRISGGVLNTPDGAPVPVRF